MVRAKTDDQRAESSKKSAALSERDALMVNSVEKCFRVLRVFDGTQASLSLSEIAEFANLDVSASQRFTHTLTKLGYLVKDPVTKRFSPTVKLLELSLSYIRGNSLARASMPYLLQLNKNTGETVNLTVLDGTDMVFVARFQSLHLFNTDVVIGTRLPAYCTSQGRAILSRLTSAEVEAVLSTSTLRPVTSRTPTTMKDVLARVGKAARDGYAIQVEETFYGDMSVSAAAMSVKGTPLGAITIATSTDRYSPTQFEARFAPLVVAAARSISEASG